MPRCFMQRRNSAEKVEPMPDWPLVSNLVQWIPEARALPSPRSPRPHCLGQRGRRGVIARKHGLKAVAKHKATEASRRRYHRGPNLVPEPRMVAAVLQQEARNPKQRFAKDGSCRARRYLIIEGWQVGFPGHFPDKTAHIAIGDRRGVGPRQ